MPRDPRDELAALQAAGLRRTLRTRDAPQGPFSTNVLWSRAIAEGRLYGIVHTGHWFEVGCPEAIAPTEEWLTRA